MTFDEAINETANSFTREGREAAHRGASERDCPYNEDSQAGRAWLRGYYS